MKHDLERYAACLRELPFIKQALIRSRPNGADGPRADAALVLTTP